MKTALRRGIIITFFAGSCVALEFQASGSPLVPIEWQQRVKSGALEGQAKHVAWSRDQNNNFVDDALEALPATNRTTMIIQLNSCAGDSQVLQFLAQHGTIRRVGTLVPYVVLDNVTAGDALIIATNSAVAAVEADKVLKTFDDTSGRAVRARKSASYSVGTTGTFEDRTSSSGGGVIIAIVDSGVDDTHPALTGKYVAGYNAEHSPRITGNPTDDNTFISTGPNGICNTAAAGGDFQGWALDAAAFPPPVLPSAPAALISIPVGQGFPEPFAYQGLNWFFNAPVIAPGGASMTIHSSLTGDDVAGNYQDPNGVTKPCIYPGPNGICDSTASGGDVQVIPVGQGVPFIQCISPAVLASGHIDPNGALHTTPTSDDTWGGPWHGTHVAGIAMALADGSGCRPATDGTPAAQNNCAGLAFGASLVDVKVTRFDGFALTSDIMDGLEWLYLNTATRVVNISIGDDSPSAGTEAISQVINTLVLNGIAVVVAAGNAGKQAIGAIASSDLAITVAAADDRGTVDDTDDVIASFSTFGPRVDFVDNGPATPPGQLKPDITAPGVGIVSTLGGGTGGYHPLDGTSMASPCVAGAAALLLSYYHDTYGVYLDPGLLKDLLKRTAYVGGWGATYADIDTYNKYWGFGLLNLDLAVQYLQPGNGIADVTFPSCLAGAAGDNCGQPCHLAPPLVHDWDNSADILLPPGTTPEADVATTITVRVENRSGNDANLVQVCVGVRPYVSGAFVSYYDVGCKTVNVPAHTPVSVSFPWTPLNGPPGSGWDHQCVFATINYGLDKDPCNNQTQRNVTGILTHSTAAATFLVDNPFKEAATIVLELQATNAFTNFTAFLEPTNVITLQPSDCPAKAQITFTPRPGLPIGTTARFWVVPTAFTASHPQGVALPGVTFDVTEVAGGIQQAYSVGRHGDQGLIKLPLNLAGVPTSDPRAKVDQLLIVFDVDVRPTNVVLTADQVVITGSPSNTVPAYTVSFEDGTNVGKRLTIQFSSALLDQQRYRVSFERFVGADGAPLLGDLDFEFRVLQGDVNNSGGVTATDLSFVRGRLGQVAAFGDSSRADVNMTGAVTATDISFVRSRIGHSAPIAPGEVRIEPGPVPAAPGEEPK
jgi:subtilisin family serine protease